MIRLTATQGLAVFWMLALVLQSVLALRTFKTRLATDGMPADRALVYATIWEAAHLILLAAMIPGLCLFVTWRYLRRVRLEEWSIPAHGARLVRNGDVLLPGDDGGDRRRRDHPPDRCGGHRQGGYGVCIALVAATLVLMLQSWRAYAVRA